MSSPKKSFVNRSLIACCASVAAFGLFNAPVAASAAISASAYQKPDFAYPKTVISDAEKAMTAAQNASDSRAMLRALINLSLAEASISQDELVKVTARIDSLIKEEKDVETRSLLSLLLAGIYADIYQSDSWAYDQRPAMLDAAKGNFTTWSGQQMADRIMALINDALAPSTMLAQTPIERYDGVIDYNRDIAAMYAPTLLDFEAMRGVEILRTFAYRNTQARMGISRIISMMLSQSGATTASRIYWQLQKLDADSSLSGDRMDTDAEFDKLKALYDSNFTATPAVGEVLLKIDELPSTDNIDRERWIYDQAKRYIATYPDYFRINCIRNMVSNFERKSADLSMAATLYPGVPVKIDLKSKNVTEVTITAYKVDNSYSLRENYYNLKRHSNLKKAASQTYRLADGDNTQYPTLYSLDITDFPALAVGRYIFDIDFNGKDVSGDNSQRIVTVTKLAVYSATVNDRMLYAVDGISGTPLKDIAFNILPNGRNKAASALGKTNKEGALTASSMSRGLVYATKGNDTSAPFSIWEYSRSNINRTSNYISAFTSLPLYHPGDTLQWSAVAYSSKGYGHELLEGRKITAIVRDANYQPFDTIRTVTDKWGRCSGQVVLPKDGLTGNFTLSLEMPDDSDKKRSVYSNCGFTVSDYKLPTYQVTLATPQRAADGGYVISGDLRTYTDLPVADAKVTLDLKSLSPMRWWIQSLLQSFYTATAQSGADGKFSINISSDVMKDAPYPRGYFVGQIVAVSTSGESQSAQTSFSPASLRQLTVDMPYTVNTTESVKLDIKVADIAGESVKVSSINYEILADKDIVKSGIINLDNPVLNLESIPNGTYDIRFRLDGETDPSVSRNVILYNPALGNPSPTDKNVWTPSSELVTDSEGKIDITYATGKDVNNVMVIMWNPETGHEYMRKWLKVSPGFNILPVKLDNGGERAFMSLIATKNFQTDQCNLTISRPDTQKKLVIEAASFRDKTSPLAAEKWTFKLRYDDGTPVEGAVIADIYSKALESIERHNQDFRPIDGQLYHISLQQPYQWQNRVGAMSPYKMADCIGLNMPQWQLWEQSWAEGMRYFSTGLRIRGSRMLYATADMAAPKMEAKNAAIAESEAAVTEEAAADMGAGESETGNEMPKDINYRPSEIPLAYFNPTISTDKDGNAVIELTMPNAVTTWQFDLIAFTRKLDTAKYSASIVSSKPMMVQPNLPRYVRAGDRIDVLTTVYNKTDQQIEATVYAEATASSNPAFKASQQTTVSIAPNGSQIVSLPIDVTVAEGNMMTIRTAATSGNFSDGEMSVIPVLSSKSSVIESQPFYIDPDSKNATITLPTMKDDATVTLQYCENPLWLAVLALPSISDEAPNTAMKAADAFLSAIAAKNLVEQYPVIGEAIKQWSAGDKSDESLKSMLERNPQLKQMMLQSTPWMREAKSDSERMARLALILDSDYTDKAIKASTAKLHQLQASSGAWRWMADDSEPSLWVTEYVLRTLGAINRLGWLPTYKDFDDMLRKAVLYLDDEAVRRYSRYPHDSYIDYAELRNLFNITQSNAAHAVSNAALREARANWKKMSSVDKAKAAILMDTHGYGDIALEVIESLNQFAITSPERGMWWEGTDITGQSIILDTYSQLQPQSKAIDRIRQWLIFQKEATTWNDNPQAALIIANLITSSPSWVVPASGVNMTLGGSPLTLPKGDYASGMFTTTLPPAQASGSTLDIQNSSTLPSWGAVIAQYVAETSAVKPHSISDLSITKEILTGVSTADGMKWTSATSMSLGSSVKVQLTIVAKHDMDYVTIVDQRAACFEPSDQLPGYISSQGLSFYRENRDSQTDIFISRLPKGTYVLTYDLSANNAGTFTSGIATIQSQMTPSLTAHSGAEPITVSK